MLNILIKSDHSQIKDFAYKVKNHFPDAHITVVDMPSEYPKKNYDICFLGNESGWETQVKSIIECARNIYIITEHEDYLLYSMMDKYKIKEILYYNNIEFELSSIATQCQGMDFTAPTNSNEGLFSNVLDNSLNRKEYIQRLVNKQDIHVPEFKLSTYLVAVTGSKGGTGKTGVSINLAASLAKAGLEVLLIDMDITKNTSSVADRLHLAYGNAKTVKDFIDGNVRETDKDEFFVKHDIDGFYILPSPGHEKEAKNLTRGVIKNILQFASPLFDVVVVDLPHSLLSPMSIILEFCDVGYIVVDPLGEGLRTVSNWNLLKNYIFPKLKVIVNLAHSTKNSAEFEVALEQLVTEKNVSYLGNIRYDEKFIRSFESGKVPVVDISCSKYRDDFKKITNDVVNNIGGAKTKSRGGILSKLFKK